MVGISGLLISDERWVRRISQPLSTKLISFCSIRTRRLETVNTTGSEMKKGHMHVFTHIVQHVQIMFTFTFCTVVLILLV